MRNILKGLTISIAALLSPLNSEAQVPTCNPVYSHNIRIRYMYEYLNGVWVNEKGFSVDSKTPGARHLPYVRGVYTNQPKPTDTLKRVEREHGLSGKSLIYILKPGKQKPNSN